MIRPAISTPHPLPRQRTKGANDKSPQTNPTSSLGGNVPTPGESIQMDDALLTQREIQINEGGALTHPAKPETHMNTSSIHNLTIYGEAPHVAASFDDNGDHAGHQLDACPFCGSTDLSLLNTHTPSYWIECEGCGAEVHGEMPDGGGGEIHTHEGCIGLHRLAMASAVTKWNARSVEATTNTLQSGRERPASFQRVLDELDAVGADTRPDLAPLTNAIRAFGNTQYDPLWMGMDVTASPVAQSAGQEAGLPSWWHDFIQNVCELPDRTSPEDEPEAMIATAQELENCALRAIEEAAEGAAPVNCGEAAQRHSIEGVAYFLRSEAEKQVCVCCPPGGGHIFSRGVNWHEWETNRAGHFGNGADVLVHKVLDANESEGKRIRVTVDVLDDANPAKGE